NVLAMDEEDIENVMETVLYDFPLNEIRINLPEWIEGLETNHWVKNNIIFALKESIAEIGKIRDINAIVEGFSELEFLDDTSVDNVELGEGVITIDLAAKQGLFYNVLEEKSGFKIEGDHQLLSLIT
ncbi:stage IV sporulation protein A, partial [Clostridium tertium]